MGLGDARESPLGRRYVIYSHDGFGMGNIRRNHAVAKRIVERDADASVLCLTSSRYLHFLPRHPRIELVKLPEVLRVGRGEYRSRTEGVAIRPLLAARREIIRGAIKGFDPDVLLVDKTPDGIAGELRPLLAGLDRDRTRVALILRDVLDEPRWTREFWARTGQYDCLTESYDAVTILGDDALFDTATACGLDRVPGVDVAYCGYLVREAPHDDPEAPEPLGDRFLISVGGGEDGLEVMQASIQALSSMAAGERPAIDVVFGPFFPADDRDRLTATFQRLTDARCTSFERHLRERIRTSRGVISMAGYNTVCEILESSAPALVVPRRHPSREQVIRASRMTEVGIVDSPETAEATPERIRDFFTSPRPQDRSRFRRGGHDGIAGRAESLATLARC